MPMVPGAIYLNWEKFYQENIQRVSSWEAFQNSGENGEGDEEKTLHEIQMYVEEKYKYRLKRNTNVCWREIQMYVEETYNNVCSL